MYGLSSIWFMMKVVELSDCCHKVMTTISIKGCDPICRMVSSSSKFCFNRLFLLLIKSGNPNLKMNLDPIVMYTIFDEKEEKYIKVEEPDPSLTYTYADYLRWKFEERLELLRGKIFQMSGSKPDTRLLAGGFLPGYLTILKIKNARSSLRRLTYGFRQETSAVMMRSQRLYNLISV